HRENAENTLLGDTGNVRKTLSDGIKRRGADIAVDNAECGDGQVLTDRSRSRRVNYGRIRHGCVRLIRLADIACAIQWASDRIQISGTVARPRQECINPP